MTICCTWLKRPNVIILQITFLTDPVSLLSLLSCSRKWCPVLTNSLSVIAFCGHPNAYLFLWILHFSKEDILIRFAHDSHYSHCHIFCIILKASWYTSENESLKAHGFAMEIVKCEQPCLKKGCVITFVCAVLVRKLWIIYIYIYIWLHFHVVHDFLTWQPTQNQRIISFF